MQHLLVSWFASTYGEGAYSSCTYSAAQGACEAANNGGGAAGGADSGLAGTGMMIALVIAVAAAMIAAGIVIFARMRAAKAKARS